LIEESSTELVDDGKSINSSTSSLSNLVEGGTGNEKLDVQN